MHPEDIKSKLLSNFPGSIIDLQDTTGTNDHFHLSIRAPQFNGVSKVKQHQMIYAVLQTEMKGPIHALSIDSQGIN